MKILKRKTLIGIVSLLIAVGAPTATIMYPEWATPIKAGAQVLTQLIMGSDNETSKL